MPQPQPFPPHRAPVESVVEPVAQAQPRQELGRFTAPVVGDVELALGLGRPIRLELDAQALELQFAGGLEVRPDDLPPATLRRLYVDLVDGVVETDNDGLGPFLDGALTLALCSVLRHLLGWRPGASATELGVRRLLARELDEARRVRLRRRFPGLVAELDPDAVLSLELRGDALELAVARPLPIRLLGLSFRVLRVRWDFATASLTVASAPLGPVRRGLVRLAEKTATRWLRARLPAAMTRPGYDLFADPHRLDHLLELARSLGAEDLSEATETEGPLRRRKKPRRPLRAREAVGGAARLFSAAKAAVVAGLAAVRVSADDPPPVTRILATIPLGPFSALALATDRGGDVAVIKVEGELHLEAPRGVYVYLDQLPELAGLRLLHARLRLAAPDDLDLDLRVEPPLGSSLEALARRLFACYLAPFIPVAALREGGVFPPTGAREHHVLWRQRFGDEREISLRTGVSAGVELRHQEDALVLLAPAGLSLLFRGLPQLPSAQLRRVEYRWRDGSLVVDGEPALGAFGQAVLAELARVRVAPHVPAGLRVVREGGPVVDEAALAGRSVEVVSVRLPVLGRLQLRMDPQDIVTAALGPAELTVTSERGLTLVAGDLGLALELRGARYDLRRRDLEIDAASPPGAYIVDLAAACVELYLVPALRKLVPLWPDADPDATWPIGHVLTGMIGDKLGLAVDLQLPPGAALTARRLPDALELGATAPLQVAPRDASLIGEFAVEAVRWRPDGERLELVTQPPAGPLLHGLVRRLHAAFTPKLVLHALAERLGLPPSWPAPPAPPAPELAPLVAPELPLAGPLAVHVDRQRPLALELRRDGARLDFGGGLVVRLPDLGIHLDIGGAAVTFLPFTVDLCSLPPAGELDTWLLSHVVRGLLARVLPWFRPTSRREAEGVDVLLTFAADLAGGPLDVCAPPGGALELLVDADRLTLRAPDGLTFVGDALSWLPAFVLRELTYRFEDGDVQLRVDGIRERHYHESEPVSRHTEQLLAHLLRVLVLPRVPAWTQRLGLRIVPRPPAPELSPGRVTVLQAQLPGGFAQVLVHMDPCDVLMLVASRREIRVDSEQSLQFDVPGLYLRLEFDRARYHPDTGEVQIGRFGQLENAIVEAAVRRTLAAYEPAAADPELSALALVLGRFPVDDDGRRVLLDSRVARLLLPADTALVVRLDEYGLIITADPPLLVDGAVGLDYRFGGVRYSFDDASFHLDLARDGVIAGLFRDKIVGSIEHQLDSLVRPILPLAMRTPGYRLARDPDPRATIAALLRTVTSAGFLLAP